MRSCRVEDDTGNVLSKGRCPTSHPVCSTKEDDVITVPLNGKDAQVRAYRCIRQEDEEEEEDDASNEDQR